MEIKINEKVIEKYDEITIGVSCFKIDINEKLRDKIDKYISENITYLTSTDKISSLKESKQLEKWKNIFERMQVKKGRESSVVFLSQYLYENKKLFFVHPIVDLYNIISIKFGIPMGCYDRNSISEYIELRTAKKGEEFFGINSKQVEKTSANEIVYSDDKGVFCRYWNDKDSERTKITNLTNEFILIFDGIDDRERIIEAANEFQNVIGLDVQLQILDKDLPKIEY